jgi:hypothetical protein
MNTSKLYNGQTFKNYKELCHVLEMEIKSSTDSKKAQMKELSRFCTFNKSGHKFIIEEVFENPLPKIENRGKSEGSRNNNSVYGEMIQLLILDLLARCRSGHLSISRGKLMLTINMVNSNYSTGGEYAKRLSKYTEIEEAIIYDFYNTSNSNFKSAVETALNNLMDRRVIWYDTVTKVAEAGTNRHRLATDEEKELIMKYEKSILDELGYERVSQVRCSKHWRLFKKKVKKLLNNNSEIKYYYFAYNITVYEEYLQEARKKILSYLLEDIDRDEYKGELNATIYFNLIENAKKRHEKGFTSRKMGEYRQRETYVDDIKKLLDLLIDWTAYDIKDELLEFEDDSLMFEEELEALFG